MNVLGLLTASTEPACREAVRRVPARFHAVGCLGEAVSRVSGGEPPAALVIDAGRLDVATSGVMHGLQRRGLLVPIRLFLAGADLNALTRAWRFPREHTLPVFSESELTEVLRAASDNSLPMRIRRDLNRVCQPRGPAEALVDLLANDVAASTWSVQAVARTLNVPRSSLYEALRSQSLPSVEQFQFLYRLLPAVLVIQSGGAVEDAAFRARLADAAALRKTLRTRLGVTVTNIRTTSGWNWIVESWLARHVVLRAHRSRSGLAGTGKGASS